MIISNQQAEIHPIAGTIPRTGVQMTDDIQLNFLVNDEKENAEHTTFQVILQQEPVQN